MIRGHILSFYEDLFTEKEKLRRMWHDEHVAILTEDTGYKDLFLKKLKLLSNKFNG